MERIWDRVAGLDVHRDWVVGCVRVVERKERTLAKQKFSTTSKGLAELAVWLIEADVNLVMTEATGVY
jgi:transposase